MCNEVTHLELSQNHHQNNQNCRVGSIIVGGTGTKTTKIQTHIHIYTDTQMDKSTQTDNIKKEC